MSQLTNNQRDALGLLLSASAGVLTVDIEQMGHHSLVTMTGLSALKLGHAIVNATTPGKPPLRGLTLWGGKITAGPGNRQTYSVAVQDDGVSPETRLIDLTFSQAIANAKA